MKIILAVLIIVTFSSCKQRELIGTWKTKNYSLWERGTAYLKGYKYIIVGGELNLNSDSTFKLSHCKIQTGKWHVKRDSVILVMDSIRYSAKDNKPEIYKPYTELFLIKKNKLINYDKDILTKTGKNGSTVTYNEYSIEILK